MEVYSNPDGSTTMKMEKEPNERTLESVSVNVKENGFVVSKHYTYGGGDYGYEPPKEYVTKSGYEAAMYVAQCLGVSAEDMKMMMDGSHGSSHDGDSHAKNMGNY